jgi:hypothetical protein
MMAEYLKKIPTIFTNYRVDIVLLAFLVLSSIKLTYSIQNLGIELYDDAVYLYEGVKITKLPLSSYRDLLYSLWYHLLSFIENDKVALYFLFIQKCY